MSSLHDTLAEFVPFQRIDAAIAAVQACPDVVTRDEHHAAVKRELDWQHHWADKWQATDVERLRLERLLNLTSVERARAVFRDIGDVPRQKTAKHEDGCRRRHAGRLALRIADLLNGLEPR